AFFVGCDVSVQRAAHYSRLFRFVNTSFEADSAPSSSTPKGFRRSEPPIMAGFSFTSTPSFEGVAAASWSLSPK
ncbi:hypothetical protein, partial [Stenotrophomonas sp. MYb238]|uniref:hypothetical protein n=1 Tax=Stenotrophomonas sp. MYb238 TaxID=2040281 RepID=UPI001D178DA6